MLVNLLHSPAPTADAKRCKIAFSSWCYLYSTTSQELLQVMIYAAELSTLPLFLVPVDGSGGGKSPEKRAKRARKLNYDPCRRGYRAKNGRCGRADAINRLGAIAPSSARCEALYKYTRRTHRPRDGRSPCPLVGAVLHQMAGTAVTRCRIPHGRETYRMSLER